MPKFRKLPVVIEAVRHTGPDAAVEIARFMGRKFHEVRIDLIDDSLTIPTLEGDHKAMPGDWIIRGVNGEFYPCKPDIFAKTYEPADD